MSANNLVWCMSYKGNWHVFYSGCADNTPTAPDYKDKYYKEFKYRSNALTYAHDIVNKMNEEAYDLGFPGVEYGVCEIIIEEDDKLSFEKRLSNIEEQLILKENAIKERLCILEDKVRNIEFGEPRKRKDGCYQFTYCNECMAYPMGLECPNLTKGPVQLKKICTEKPQRDCDECVEYSVCDHQGAYKKNDGKWCYE